MLCIYIFSFNDYCRLLVLVCGYIWAEHRLCCVLGSWWSQLGRWRVCNSPRTLADMLLILLLAGRSWGRATQRKKEGISDHWLFCVDLKTGWSMSMSHNNLVTLSRHHLWADATARCILHTYPSQGYWKFSSSFMAPKGSECMLQLGRNVTAFLHFSMHLKWPLKYLPLSLFGIVDSKVRDFQVWKSSVCNYLNRSSPFNDSWPIQAVGCFNKITKL